MQFVLGTVFGMPKNPYVIKVSADLNLLVSFSSSTVHASVGDPKFDPALVIGNVLKNSLI